MEHTLRSSVAPRSRFRAPLSFVAGAFVADSIAWIGAALSTSGDFFAGGNVQIGVMLLVASALGGFAAAQIRSKRLTTSLAIATALCLLFWVAVPDGWWASPPPPPEGAAAPAPH